MHMLRSSRETWLLLVSHGQRPRFANEEKGKLRKSIPSQYVVHQPCNCGPLTGLLDIKSDEYH